MGVGNKYMNTWNFFEEAKDSMIFYGQVNALYLSICDTVI